MKKFATYDEAVTAKSDSSALAAYVMDRVGRFSDGEDVQLDFLSHAQVGQFCKALGFTAKRNWAVLPDTEIAPMGEEGVQIVPAKEAKILLDLVRDLIANKTITPVNKNQAKPEIVNDFLPKGTTFAKKPCLGHLWEWQYALAVELEHGRMRGMNVTNNHPLLTCLVVLAHLAEDHFYYARLWVMELEGAVYEMQTKRTPYAQLQKQLEELTEARMHLQERLGEDLSSLAK